MVGVIVNLFWSPFLRIIKAELFVKAIHKPTKASQTPLRVKEVYRFEEINKIFDRWEKRSMAADFIMSRISIVA